LKRLHQVFGMLGQKLPAKSSPAIRGLVEEAQEIIEEGWEEDVVSSDLALIAVAQKVEHFEIAGYGTARTLARQMGLTEGERLLSDSLEEEEKTDLLLAQIADPLLAECGL